MIKSTHVIFSYIFKKAIKMKTIVIATKNKNKVKEFKEIANQDLNIRFVAASELGINFEAEETGKSFRENAFIKAKTLRNITEQPVIGEDSGLCVDELDGRPGIYSARFAGKDAGDEENIKKLLDSLKNSTNRHAYFVCTICLLIDNQEFYFEGILRGEIALKPRGKNGFGYDPVFIPEGFQQTLAELGPDIKNKISHRKKAIIQLTDLLKNHPSLLK